jgi:hypothetical protein
MFNLKDLKSLKSYDKDDLLDLIGLQTRQTAADWILPTIGAFSVGVLVGAGIGLMLAPKPGRELREDLRTRLQGGAEQLATNFAGATGSSTSTGVSGGVSGSVDKPITPRSL